MKKFIIKVLIFLSLIALTISIVSFWFEQTIYYQNLLTSRETIKFGINDRSIINQEIIKFEPLSEDITVANFGSSHGRAAFDYINNNLEDSFNFALSSQLLTYDLKLLQHYGERISEGAVLFFPISYMSLYWDEFNDMDEFEKSNIRYYDILDYDEIEKVELSFYIMNKLSPVLVSEELNLLEIIMYDKPLAMYQSKWYTNMLEMSQDEIVESSISVTDYHKQIIGEQVVDTRMNVAIIEIIDYCDENGFTPVFVTTPFYSDYNEQFSSEFYDQFYKDVELIIENNGELYLDYSHHELFVNDKSLFSDSNHLNQQGAQKFTKIVICDIEDKIDINLY